MSLDDVWLNKQELLTRSLARIREEYHDNDSQVINNLTVQDSILLNLQRACEVSIDLAMYVAAKERLGLPQTSREAFTLLAQASIIPEMLANELRNMVAFRNIAVDEYQKLKLDILIAILRTKLHNFTDYLDALRLHFTKAQP